MRFRAHRHKLTSAQNAFLNSEKANDQLQFLTGVQLSVELD